VTAAREDRAAIVAAVEVVTDALTVLLETLSQQRSPVQAQAAKQVRAATEQLPDMTAEMLTRGGNQEPDLGFAAVAQAAARSEAKSARKRWRHPAWETVRDALETILPRLWSMIGHLLKVKDWTVQGQVGMPALGLLGASVSVTFGKS
jgi:hypothetical protein